MFPALNCSALRLSKGWSGQAARQQGRIRSTGRTRSATPVRENQIQERSQTLVRHRFSNAAILSAGTPVPLPPPLCLPPVSEWPSPAGARQMQLAIPAGAQQECPKTVVLRRFLRCLAGCSPCIAGSHERPGSSSNPRTPPHPRRFGNGAVAVSVAVPCTSRLVTTISQMVVEVGKPRVCS